MKEPPISTLDERTRRAVDQALGRVPCGLFLMTAEHEQRTRGALLKWVQRVSNDPAMVLVALEKGHEIIPLIHGSHGFALNQIAADDKLTLRKFAGTCDERDDDPLQSLDVARRVTGSPVLRRAQAFLDCELLRHLDVEGDHDLYIGLVRDGGTLRGGEVHVTPAPPQ